MPDSAKSEKADQLACSLDDCFEWDNESEFGIQQGDRNRASAIDLYAREMGARFVDVRCTRIYARIFTLREVWEDHLDDLLDDKVGEWADNHEPELKWADGAWRDVDGNTYEAPEFEVTMPDDWRPDEHMPAWQVVEKSTPGAIPAWRLELR